MDVTHQWPDENIEIDNTLRLCSVSERFIDPLFMLIERHRNWLQQSMNWPEAVTCREDVVRVVNSNMLLHHRGYSKMYMIELASELVGVISFNQIEPGNKTAYIGYWRIPDCPRKGVVSLALNALLNHYSAEGSLRRFVIKCIVTNRASNRVAKRNGFEREGRLKQAEFLNGQFLDQYLYARIVDNSPSATPSGQ